MGAVGRRGGGKELERGSSRIEGLDPGRPAYERQDAESDVAWEAFVHYRDSPIRSLRNTTNATGKSWGTVSQLSVKWSWRVRVEEWDREVDRKKREATLNEVFEMRKRQLQLARSVQGYGAEQLSKLMTEARNNPKATLTADQVAKLIVEGIKLERLNMNEPQAIEEQRVRDTDEAHIKERIEHLLKARRNEQ